MNARILILEDDSHLRSILTRVLTLQGYEVSTAERGLEAVEMATQNPFDLVIADIRMEGMDGLEAVRLTKEHQPEIGTLIVSGYASDEETSRAEQLQVGGYLKKPFKTSELLRRVRELLSEKASAVHRKSQGDLDREAMLWSLEQTLQWADQSGEAGPEGFLRGVCGAARRLARSMGLVAHVSGELSVAAGVMALANATGTEPPESIRQSSLLTTFKLVFKEQQDGSTAPLERSLVELAVLSQELERDKGRPARSEQIAEAHPGRFPASLLAVLDDDQGEPQSEEAPETVAPARAGVSVYSLARALERGGDKEGAERAYLEVARQETAGATGVRAMLAAGRLAMEAGRSEQAAELVQKAQQWAPRFGPSLNALANLEWGCMLASMGRVEPAQEALTRAVGYLETLELWPEWSRGQLALMELGVTPGERDIERFRRLSGHPGLVIFGTDLTSSLPPLLELFEQGAFPQGQPFEALLRAAPKSLEKTFPELEEKHRLLLVQALVATGKPCPEELVRQISADESAQVREQAQSLVSTTSEVISEEVLRIYSLGVFQVFRGEERISDADFKTQKIRYLLAYLAAEKGRARPTEALIELFWPDKGQKGRYSLNWAVSALRSVFRSPSSEVVIRERDKLFLDPKVPRWHDLDELEEALKRARKADADQDHSTAWRGYRRAAELYRGEYLEGCYLDWALQRQARIANVMADSYLKLAHYSEQAGQTDEAQAALSQHLEIRPHSQQAHLQKIQLFTQSGEPQLAIEHYRKCEELLRVEYEVEPSTDIIRAYHEARLSL